MRQIDLMRSRKFFPLFATQFLGAFNDNFFKSALVILITYELGDALAIDPRILVTAAAGFLILPFFLFSATAGQIADKYERSGLVRVIKGVELILMVFTSAAFYLKSVPLLMLLLFLMGAQSTFFGPLKYSILPQHLAEDELIAGNALIEAGTFLAILGGTIFGGLLVLGNHGILIVGSVIVGAAVWGLVASWFIPSTIPVDPNLKIDPNIVLQTARIIKDGTERRDVFLSILGISWFWFVGSTFLAQFPSYSKYVVGADEQVATLFLAVFSVGVALGSLGVNKLLKGEVSSRYVPGAAAAMSFASILLFLCSERVSPHPDHVVGIWEFLATPGSWPVLASLLAISAAGGVYIVPLYAIVQTRTAPEKMARVVACINVTDSLFMVLSAVGTTLLLALRFSVPQIFLVMAILTLAAAWLIGRTVKDAKKRAKT